MQTLTISIRSPSYVYTSGNHTYAAIKGAESYELLSQGLESVIADVNQVVDGQVKLEFYLGSDYKVVFCDHVVSNVRITATSLGGLPLRFFLYPAILLFCILNEQVTNILLSDLFYSFSCWCWA